MSIVSHSFNHLQVDEHMIVKTRCIDKTRSRDFYDQGKWFNKVGIRVQPAWGDKDCSTHLFFSKFVNPLHNCEELSFILGLGLEHFLSEAKFLRVDH